MMRHGRVLNKEVVWSGSPSGCCMECGLKVEVAGSKSPLLSKFKWKRWSINEGKTVGNKKCTIPAHHGIVTQFHKSLSGCSRSEESLGGPWPRWPDEWRRPRETERGAGWKRWRVERRHLWFIVFIYLCVGECMGVCMCACTRAHVLLHTRMHMCHGTHWRSENSHGSWLFFLTMSVQGIELGLSVKSFHWLGRRHLKEVPGPLWNISLTM